MNPLLLQAIQASTPAAAPPAGAALLSGAGNATTHVPTSAGTTTVLNKPANLVDGQFLIAIMTNRTQSSVAMTPPSGWTQLYFEAGAAGRSNTYVYVRFVASAAGEPASYTWTWATSSSVSGVMAIATGLDSAALPALSTGTAATFSAASGAGLPATASFGVASGGTISRDMVLCFAQYRGGVSTTITYTPTTASHDTGTEEIWGSAENCWMGAYAYDGTSTASVGATITGTMVGGRSNFMVLKGA